MNVNLQMTERREKVLSLVGRRIDSPDYLLIDLGMPIIQGNGG